MEKNAKKAQFAHLSMSEDERHAESTRKARIAWLLLGRTDRFTRVMLSEAATRQAGRKRTDLSVFVEKLFGYGSFDTLLSMPRKTWIRHGVVIRLADNQGYQFTSRALAEFAKTDDIPELARDVVSLKSEPEPKPERPPVDTFMPGDAPVNAETVDLAVILLGSDAVTYWRKTAPSETDALGAWELRLRSWAPIAPDVIGQLVKVGVLSAEGPSDDYRVTTDAAVLERAMVTPWVLVHFQSQRPPPAADVVEDPVQPRVAIVESALASAVRLCTDAITERAAHDSVPVCEERIAELRERLEQAQRDLERAQAFDARAKLLQPYPRLMGQVRQDAMALQARLESEALERLWVSIGDEAKTLNRPFAEVAQMVVERLAATDRGNGK